MHRNTYLVVSILAVLAALVVGVNVGKKINTTAEISSSPTPTAAPMPEEKLSMFTDTACGLSLQYGAEFTLMDNASGSAILNNATDKIKSIAMTCQKEIPRPALAADKIESFTIPTTPGASVSAKLYHTEASKDGTLIDAVIFTHPTNKLDVFIAGYGEPFNAIIKTIQILP